MTEKQKQVRKDVLLAIMTDELDSVQTQVYRDSIEVDWEYILQAAAKGYAAKEELSNL